MKRRTGFIIALGLAAWLSHASKGQDDLSSVSSEQRTVDGNPNQTYFLIDAAPEAAAPESGYGLLFVLPGGSGSAEFNPFVQRIAKHAAPPGFLVVQLVAPVWRENPPVVWPTQHLPDESQQFTTEEFVSDVLEDVGDIRHVDDSRLLLMGWSSSGPVVYSMLCAPDTPFDGFYVSMSVFKPLLMPPIAAAAGRRIFIEHSPDDRICPFRLAEQARDALTEVGAIVHFETTAGGHGWRGAIYPRMRKAFEFLLKPETNASTPVGEPDR